MPTLVICSTCWHWSSNPGWRWSPVYLPASVNTNSAGSGLILLGKGQPCILWQVLLQFTSGTNPAEQQTHYTGKIIKNRVGLPWCHQIAIHLGGRYNAVPLWVAHGHCVESKILEDTRKMFFYLPECSTVNSYILHQEAVDKLELSYLLHLIFIAQSLRTLSRSTCNSAVAHPVVVLDWVWYHMQ